MQWYDKTFADLTVQELFQILKLRAEVFNTEQNSTYCDPDDQDPLAHHVFAIDNGQVAAYARYFKEKNYVTFGRVVVAKNYRGHGLGVELIKHVLAGIKQNYPQLPISIHSQTYVVPFYEKFAFVKYGKEFIEADRKHYLMKHEPLNQNNH